MLDRSRHELAVVTTALSIFERDGGRSSDQRPAHVRNLFKRFEVLRLCKAALADRPEGMTTRELGIACLQARGYAHTDPVLIRAMVGVLSNTLKKAERRGEMVRTDTAGRQAAWQLVCLFRLSRVGCALRKMRATRVVEGERTQAGQVW